MAPETISALAMFGIYAIYVLLPIIPTVVIYRMFPDTTVSIGGVIQGLRIDATGAFAAYIATVLLGTWIAKSAVGLVQGYERSMWTVTADVELRDPSGRPLNDAQDLEQLTVDLVPPIFQTSDKSDTQDPAHPIYLKHVEVRVPVMGDNWPRLKYTVPSYAAFTPDVQVGKRDETHHVIKLDTVNLVKEDKTYPANANPLAEQPTARAYPGTPQVPQ